MSALAVLLRRSVQVWIVVGWLFVIPLWVYLQ